MTKNKVVYNGDGVYIAKPEIIKIKKVVIEDEQIEIEFDYPLSRAVRFTYKKKGGFTVSDLIDRICKGYKRIYREEDKDVGKTDLIPGMLNRQTSSGRYGIWGHCLEDLVIEMITYNPNKKLVLLAIGS